MLQNGAALLPYLGDGSAALGYAAAAAQYHGIPLGDGLDPQRTRVQVARSLRCPVVPDAGLMRGRAGNLMVLERLVPGDPDVRHHRDRLSWHVLPGSSAARPVPGDLVLGNQHLRCSADLGTGAAGMLLALADQDAGECPLGWALSLPRTGRRGVMEET